MSKRGAPISAGPVAFATSATLLINPALTALLHSNTTALLNDTRQHDDNTQPVRVYNYTVSGARRQTMREASLDAGNGTLGTGRWELDAGNWMPGTERWELDAGNWMPGTGRRELDAGNGTLGTGRRELDAGN